MSGEYLLNPSFTINEALGIYTDKDQGNNNGLSYNPEGHANCFAVEDNSFWFNHRNNIISNCLDNYLEKDSLFLDVGGGNGFVSKHLHNNGYNPVLLEPKIDGALNAKNRGLENVICGLLSKDTISENSIDSIGIFDVIEHIEDDLEFAKTIHHSLKKEGYLFVTVPAFQSLWSYHDVQAGHFRRYTKKSISEVLIKAGFEVEYLSYFFSVLVFPNYILRSIPTKLGFAKSYDDKKTKAKHHVKKDSVTNKILNKFWSLEISKIKKKKYLPFGNSIIIVARK